MFGLESTCLMSMVRQRATRFYGHIRRHSSLQKTIAEGMVEGKRGRGRMRSNWLDNIARNTGMGINRCAEMVMDRAAWRIMVFNVVADTEQ